MTHTKDELLKLALEALENGKRVRNADGGTKYQPELEDKAILAIKQALAAPVQDAENKWRTLALQFDAHRMSALAHLQAMVQDPAKHAEVAREFLSAPPPAECKHERVDEDYQIASFSFCKHCNKEWTKDMEKNT
jgi:hypothetical protein